MKQKIEIRASDGDTTVRLTAIIVTNGALTRDEVRAMREQWADRLMQTIPTLRYTDIPLSRVRVR